MKVVKLSRKKFKEEFGDVDAMTLRYKGTEPTIYIPGKASTKEMLHEIYHATRSPNLKEIEEGKKWQTGDELAREELRAQGFAVESMGKATIPWTMMGSIAKVMLNGGHKPTAILASIERALEEEDYEPLSSEAKSELWWYIREEYDKQRGKK